MVIHNIPVANMSLKKVFSRISTQLESRQEFSIVLLLFIIFLEVLVNEARQEKKIIKDKIERGKQICLHRIYG